MPWVTCANCGYEWHYAGPKPPGASVTCPKECGGTVRIRPGRTPFSE